MSGEARVQASMQIVRGSSAYRSPSAGSFAADVTGLAGPTPGSLAVTTAGLNVNLAQITAPGGWCWLQNNDATNYLIVGVHDGVIFHPLLELLPGEAYPVRLARDLGEEEDVPGTGTTGVVNNLFVRASAGTIQVIVEAFDK